MAGLVVHNFSVRIYFKTEIFFHFLVLAEEDFCTVAEIDRAFYVRSVDLKGGVSDVKLDIKPVMIMI